MIRTVIGGGTATIETATATDQIATTDTTIPAGFIHGSIAVLSGTATINGSLYQAGEQLILPPMSFGNVDRRYPLYQVTGVSGEVRINYLA